MKALWTGSLVAALCVGCGMRHAGEETAGKPDSDYRAVTFAGTEKDDTAKLNGLAAEGWEYVGPLGTGTVAFRRAKRTGERVELGKLKGTWVLAAREEGGATAPADAGPTTLALADTRWETRSGGAVLRAGTFTIDASADPKRITFSGTDGVTGHAIYKFDGDAFVYCAREGEPGSRPTDFTTKAGDGRLLMTWKRVAE
jgi:uncharacterized protein (TIGR03067 family)